MKVQHLKIQNFRGINELNLQFSKTEPIVFIGINGVGKSSILDCLSILLSRFTTAIHSNSASGKSFHEDDITNKKKETQNEVEVLFDSKKITWSLAKVRSGRSRNIISNLKELRETTESIRNKLSRLDNTENLPVIVYYPTNRAVLDIPMRIRKKHDFDQVAAYDQGLTAGKIEFRTFFEWFRKQEDLENEIRLNSDNNYRDIKLESVRKAISSLLTDFSNLRVQRSPLRMIVTKGSEQLIINQLSDGQKCLMAMVGDLARRIAIANPGLPDPLQGAGVVLIDEVELHLHPGWQYEIIPALTETFPNCQFIMTTHSPIVLSQVKSEGIFCIDRDSNGKVIAYHPDSSYGRDVNQILEDLMGVPRRPKVFKDKLRELFRFIDEGDLDKAKALQQHLETEIGLDEPEFARADVLIRRQEILGR